MGGRAGKLEKGGSIAVAPVGGGPLAGRTGGAAPADAIIAPNYILLHHPAAIHSPQSAQTTCR